jgi:FlaA1/EpsC-like NDP-sugar epimerase
MPGRRQGSALAAFEAVRNRHIPDFDRVHLPPYRSVVVTGGTGCIGTAMLRLLSNLGATRLSSISRRPPGPDALIPGVDYELADIRDSARIREILDRARPELVIHLAGQRRPDLAERHVSETITSNVFGTKSVLAAAGRSGVQSVVTASTGKALRYFAPEIYAASKKLAEYLVSQAPARWGVTCSTVRFTHVVDNSIVYGRLRRWAQAGQPVRLHAPGIGFYAQSAREAAQLLAAASSHRDGSPRSFALSDIGWPHDLLALARDVIEDEASTSSISFTGYQPGYEERLFPGTVDPLQSDRSPLFNAIEAERSGSLHSVESVSLHTDPDDAVDDALAAMEHCMEQSPDEASLRHTLHDTSVALLKRVFALSTPGELAGVCRLADGKVGEIPEHELVYRHLMEAAESAGALALTGSDAPSPGRMR